MLLGGGDTALAVARSLGDAEVRVYALGSGFDSVRFSRGCETFVRLGRGAGIQERWLEWLSSAPVGSVVLPCEDEGLELVGRNRELLLELGLVPFEADDDVLLAMLDKRATYRRASAIGIEVPLSFSIHAQADLAVALSPISYPCALKPLRSHEFARHFAGMKAFVVNNEDELRDAMSRTDSAGVETMVTEIIPGPDDQFCSLYSYLDEDGEPLLQCTKRKLRQHPIGFGAGCYHVTDCNPEAAELGLRFFQGMGLRGLGSVEFKRDERDGRLKLIECNHRFTAATGLLRAAGLDLPLFVYNTLLDRPPSPVQVYRTGLTMWCPAPDVRAFVAYRRNGQISLRAWLRGVVRRHHFPVASLVDPRPALVNHLRLFSRLRRLLGRRRMQRTLPASGH